METNEAFPAREKNPADLAKLEGYNPKMAETSCAKLAGADRRAGKANEAWALYKWNAGVTFPMNYASIMAEVSLPRWKHLYIWIFSPQEFSRTSLLYCAPQKILPHQLSHCKIQPKLQSWQNETILVVVIRAHSSATYSTFSRHLFYKPNRKNMAILIGIPTWPASKYSK